MLPPDFYKPRFHLTNPEVLTAAHRSIFRGVAYVIDNVFNSLSKPQVEISVQPDLGLLNFCITHAGSDVDVGSLYKQLSSLALLDIVIAFEDDATTLYIKVWDTSPAVPTEPKAASRKTRPVSDLSRISNLALISKSEKEEFVSLLHTLFKHILGQVDEIVDTSKFCILTINATRLGYDIMLRQCRGRLSLRSMWKAVDKVVRKCMAQNLSVSRASMTYHATNQEVAFHLYTDIIKSKGVVGLKERGRLHWQKDAGRILDT